MNQTDVVLIPAKGLADVIAAIFRKAGADQTEAAHIGEHLVDANLAGHDSHGVVRVPRYLEAQKNGHVHFGRNAKVVLESDNFAVLDGLNGFGQTLGHQLLKVGIDKARQHGVSLVALRNAGHLGRIGGWAELACNEGLVSVHFVNVAHSLLVAPFGGAERRMSTAPVTIGVPSPDTGDFILDFATSKVAEGKALIALKGGKPLPEGALKDADGQPTADPSALYGEVAPDAVPNPRLGPGAINAMGDHKGSGLALACELLAGALTGSGATGKGHNVHNGMFSIFVNPSAIDDGHGYATAVSEYIEFVRDCRPADPTKPVLIPGDPERATRAARLRDGVPLGVEPWENILSGGTRQGMSRDELLSIAGMA